MNKASKITTAEGRKPNPVDIHVGTRLRMRRMLLGFSQEKLAEHLGLTFQQVQKYERGTNRISASRLYELSKILDVPISYFYDNYSDSSSSEIDGVAMAYGLSENDQDAFDIDNGILMKKETIELVRVFYSLPDENLRRDLLKMIKTMASNMHSGE